MRITVLLVAVAMLISGCASTQKESVSVTEYDTSKAEDLRAAYDRITLGMPEKDVLSIAGMLPSMEEKQGKDGRSEYVVLLFEEEISGDDTRLYIWLSSSDRTVVESKYIFDSEAKDLKLIKAVNGETTEETIYIWTKVAEASGAANFTGEDFEIKGDKVRFAYEVKMNSITGSVYFRLKDQAGQEVASSFQYETKSGEDPWPVIKPGTYHLEVESRDASWTVKVQDFVPNVTTE